MIEFTKILNKNHAVHVENQSGQKNTIEMVALKNEFLGGSHTLDER